MTTWYIVDIVASSESAQDCKYDEHFCKSTCINQIIYGIGLCSIFCLNYKTFWELFNNKI
jgi:hypothetical protein